MPPPSDGPRMRVLALHGGGANSNVMRGMVGVLQRALGAAADFDFIDGIPDYNMESMTYGHPDFTVQGHVVEPGPMIEALAKGQPLLGWYASTCKAPPEDRRNWLVKLNDPSVDYVIDEQADKSAEQVLEHLEAHGPYDVVLAFSQATVLVHIITGLLRERGKPIPWRLSVLFSPFTVRDKRFARLFRTPLSQPAVFCYGRTDWAYEYGRHSIPAYRLYENPVILEHEEGHGLPTKMAKARPFYAEVVREMWSHCGAQLWTVVGGGDKGGILVRASRDAKPQQDSLRLSTGALVKGLELEGERLRYELLVGKGPATGWVTLSVAGKALLTKAVPAAAEEQNDRSVKAAPAAAEEQNDRSVEAAPAAAEEQNDRSVKAAPAAAEEQNDRSVGG